MGGQTFLSLISTALCARLAFHQIEISLFSNVYLAGAQWQRRPAGETSCLCSWFLRRPPSDPQPLIQCLSLPGRVYQAMTFFSKRALSLPLTVYLRPALYTLDCSFFIRPPLLSTVFSSFVPNVSLFPVRLLLGAAATVFLRSACFCLLLPCSWWYLCANAHPAENDGRRLIARGEPPLGSYADAARLARTPSVIAVAVMSIVTEPGSMGKLAATSFPHRVFSPVPQARKH